LNKMFSYESDLVSCFTSNHPTFPQCLLINEMPIRWGNIDLVEIRNSSLPFSFEQCKLLEKPSNAKIFMRLNNNRAISKSTLFKGLGMSESTFEKALTELIKCGLVYRHNNLYNRNIHFVFPKTIITGYEAKLTDYNKALYQARINRDFVDYSYMVFPFDEATKIMAKYKQIIETSNLGLIGVSHTSNTVLIKPTKSLSMKPYIRLMNLVISQSHIQKAAI